jgi:hypothetical protein
MDELVARNPKQEGGFTWEDIWFMQLNRFANARNQRDLDNYRISCETMEILLSAVEDGEYYENKQILDIDFSQGTLSEKQYYDKLSKELVSLLARATAKKEDLREHVETSTIINQIARQMKNGIGQNLMITGSMGSGKSWASLKIAEKVVEQTGGNFTHEHIVSSLEDFMQMYNDKNKCPPGSVLIFEEVGINVNSKKAMTKLNIAFADVFQTSRYKELLILLNAPAVSFLDKTPRSLLHWWFQTDKLHKSEGFCEIRPHMVELDQIRGELLFPYPRLRDGQRITRLEVNAPSKDLREKYEKTSRAYKDKVGSDSAYYINNQGFDKKQAYYIELRKQGKTQKDCIAKLGKSSKWALRIEKECRNKGIELPEMRGIELKRSAKSKSSNVFIHSQAKEGGDSEQ